MSTKSCFRAAALSLLTACLIVSGVSASSHREAPAITASPKVDATDFYMFKSYEPGRGDYVTFIANYIPLQDAYGGPNYFTMDTDARYEIKIDNNGDALEDLTFRFRFKVDSPGVALQIGPEGNSRTVAVPLVNVGQISATDRSALNLREIYTIEVAETVRNFGFATTRPVRNAANSETIFDKPIDNIGAKSIPDYARYAAAHVYDIDVPNCNMNGRVFVGQRKDPFVVNLGEIFDLVNLDNPVGDPDAESDDLSDKNVTSLILELHQDCLTSGRSDVIGAWTTASLPAKGDDDSKQAAGRRGPFGRVPNAALVRQTGQFRQVSRLSNPLVNEVVIGLEDKDRFNASHPKDDAQFLQYVTHPTLPALLELLFDVPAPTEFPRTDLVAAFLTGVDGLNRTATPAEMLRLNTAIAPTAAGSQNRLGVIGGDLAGFPNGRRPGDDVVDIALRVVMGVLLPESVAPVGSLPFTDGALVDDSFFTTSFPYLLTPIAGSPN